MKKAKKIAIITAVSMIAVGIICLVGSLALIRFDVAELDTMKWETKTYTIEETFSNISVRGGEAAVNIVPATDGICKVVCTENEAIYDKVSVVDQTLTIERVDERQWYHDVGMHFAEVEITVYLPENEYGRLFIDNDSGRVDVLGDFTFAEADVHNTSGRTSFKADVEGTLKVENTSGGMYVGDNSVGDLSIKGTSGSIEVMNVVATGTVEVDGSSGGISVSKVECENLSVQNSSGVLRLSEIVATGNVKVKGTSGGVHLDGIECESLTGENSSGKINCTDVIASGELKLDNSTGGISLEACDASTINLSATSGSIRGTLLTNKIFVAEATSGSVDVPMTGESDEICTVTTTSGSIKMSIVE